VPPHRPAGDRGAAAVTDMALILLAAAIAGLGALAGAALLGLRARARFRRTPGAFRCTVRLPDQPHRTRFGRGRRPTSAVWVHDVLLVRRGMFGQQIAALPVRIPEDGPEPAAGTIRGLGPEPYLLSLRLDGGQLVDVALPAEARVPAVGPFLAAAMRGLPDAPAERRRRRH
jgi:hypothetical protein